MFDLKRISECALLASLEHHAQIGSTNDRAKQLAAAPSATELPMLILADTQTAGRGRGENRWQSAPGALTFSLLLDPQRHGISADRLPAVSITTASAVCDLAETLAGVELKIKWPNDVVDQHGRKVAGILLEAPRSDRLVIGVGINLHSAPLLSATPLPLADRAEAVQTRSTAGQAAAALPGRQAVSLAELATGTALDPTITLCTLLDAFKEALARLARNDALLWREWNGRNALGGREVTLGSHDARHTGVCEGFAHNGALRLSEGETIREHLAGTVLAVR
ncbi:biotin--[acetyl-CoA-carboxylase] ligase [Botrimarina hoheduenensis]|uniref:Bifunctional ligase/repressor BirA n=1 Tax=Botrimarina hoheduenensis TaxID=2528000 RepID=A0A5C5WEX5_9BACT|nr:biotin--[acetyl-CoA-carboxylase] ligase [Botrimarina hoheduenensis]TWT48629.1 Bifunctional ligase/repressor BirA [Botrimarina hoheduenensis]